ncbi:MAG: hypothetical protein ABW178_13640 [Pseudoxanthomonas sp.]
MNITLTEAVTDEGKISTRDQHPRGASDEVGLQANHPLLLWVRLRALEATPRHHRQARDVT